jgi:hypothetical protein
MNIKKLQLPIPWDLGDYNIQTSKFFFFWVIVKVNFFTSKFMIIRWYSFYFESFAMNFENKLSICGSNLNSI